MRHKYQLRQQLKSQRAELTQQQQQYHAIRACLRLSQFRAFRVARHIGTYAPIQQEISPTLLQSLWPGKHFYYPKTLDNGSMEFSEASNRHPLVKSHMQLMEPTAPQVCHINQLDCMLIPLLGFTIHGQRIGFGGGYYDRYLQRFSRHQWHRKPVLIGLAYPFQQIDFVESEPWDVSLHHVFTAQEHIHCR